MWETNSFGELGFILYILIFYVLWLIVYPQEDSGEKFSPGHSAPSTLHDIYVTRMRDWGLSSYAFLGAMVTCRPCP